MKKSSLIQVPLFSPGWKKIAYALFPVAVVLVIVMAILRVDISPDEGGNIIYGLWAVAFGILNLTKQDEEDEMIQSLRLQAFQTGFYWLIWGLLATAVINLWRYGSVNADYFTAYLVLFLLNAYIFAAFKYQVYQSNKN